MAASATPNRAASRSGPAALRGRPGLQIATRIAAANAVRSSTVPLGPSSSNRVVATAAPICTDATEPSTSPIAVARCARPKLFPGHQQPAQQPQVLDEGAGAEEPILDAAP